MTKARELGIVAFALFAVLHWLCDLVWLEALSWTSFRGTQLLGARSQQVVVGVCGAALGALGGWYVYRSGADAAGLVG